MNVKPPKNDRNYFWTMHSQRKLFQYGLSPNKIKRIIRYPDRKEEGIALDTIAVMQRKNKKNPQKGEIWVMYQRKLKVKSEKLKVKNEKAKVEKDEKLQAGMGQIKIISAWIYPAETPKGKEIFVPDEVWEELMSSG